MKIQNIFARGILNKDADPRFVDSAELIDAENFLVSTTQGNSAGVGKNSLGNVKRSNLNIPGAKTIGVGKNETKEKIYNFVKGTYHDYIIEYDCNTFTASIVGQSTTGTRLNFKDGERIFNVNVISGQQGEGDLILWSGDSNPPRIGNIERMKTWGVDGFTAEEIMLIKAPPTYPPEVVQVNTIGDAENYLKERFVSFSYRYKYKDGYYSAISSWQEYSFSPGNFDLDFASFENKGMVNIYNACDITFNVGPREVESIDLLFKESNSTIVYRVDKYVKSDEGWSDNSDQTIQFNNSKIYSVLPQDQYFRSFDNVPEYSVAQTVAGNRSMFANYMENKDLIDKNNNKVVMDYTVGFESVGNQEFNSTITNIDNTSPFTPFPSIDNGIISIDFTGSELVNKAAIGIAFNIKSIVISPQTAPPRDQYEFKSTYTFLLQQDYADISALVADTANGFKDGLEVYFTSLFKNSIVNPPNTLLPFTFFGFVLGVTSSNVISITLPIIQFPTQILPDPIVYVNEYYQNISTKCQVNSVGVKKSMKSYKSYEIGMIYRDLQVRKTTPLTSEKNTVFIPLSSSINKNTITVSVPTTQKPPVWAKTYKFAIKENRVLYEEIYASTFYKDGTYRWIKLDGVSLNKVQVGSNLLIKKDINTVYSIPVFTKVLEIKTEPEDFITGNVDEDGNDIIELSGTYFKIKPEGFSIDYSKDEFTQFITTGGAVDYPFQTYEFRKETTPGVFVNTPIPQGSTFSVKLHSDYHRESEQNDYSNSFIASQNYTNFKEFFDSEIAAFPFKGSSGATFASEMLNDYELKITGTSHGTDQVFGTKRGFLDTEVTLRAVSGYFIFETQGKDTDNDIFYETPDVFDVIDGEHSHVIHVLDKTFNCYVQGNGSESYQIRDAFNEKFISIDFSPTAVSVDEYKQINRSSDITYSGVYNSNTNVNKLNEFNLYLANYKEDIDKEYGPIYKIKGQETNIQVFQEDKDSQVFYGKDILYNADGTSNLAQISDVLGIQDEYAGDYGISTHPDSCDFYGFDTYHTDVKRGVVIKKSNNGLFEASSQQMRSYFKKLFRDNTINHVNGKYDQYNDFYLLNIQYNDTEYVTWVYSDKDNGWLGRLTFNPEDMIRVNSKFLSFKDGEIYEHNSTSAYNTFYGIESPSTFKFNFSQTPSERKSYKQVEMEATDAWDLAFETDLDKGFINKEDFVKQEGVFDAYIRTSNEATDTSLLSCQGIGTCTIDGLILNFSFDLDSVVSIGDKIINISKQLVGTILSKTENSLTLNTVNNLINGDYVMCSKLQSVENSALLGYHMTVTATLSKNTLTEVFAVNSEVVKSHA